MKTLRLVKKPNSHDVFGIANLTQRQVEIIMGALATLYTDNEKVGEDGYAMYSDLFDSVVAYNEVAADQIELNPYVIGTLSGTDPSEALRALIEDLKGTSAA